MAKPGLIPLADGPRGKSLLQRIQMWFAGGSYGDTCLRAEPPDKATYGPWEECVVSKLGNGKHAPLFDFDFGCELLPSRTPGHYHLYCDIEVDEEKYWKVLQAMADAGMLQAKWVESCIDAGTMILRIPTPEAKMQQLKQRMIEEGTLFPEGRGTG